MPRWVACARALLVSVGVGWIGGGCDGGGAGASPDDPATEGVGEDLDAVDAQGCPALLSEDKSRTYSLDIDPDEMAKLDQDFHDVQAVLAGMPPKVFHPATFQFGPESVPAAVRLKGQSSWADTVTYDKNPKMQLVVAFDRQDPSARFHGLSKIVLDMPRADWTFLNERRRRGLPW